MKLTSSVDKKEIVGEEIEDDEYDDVVDVVVV